MHVVLEESVVCGCTGHAASPVAYTTSRLFVITLPIPNMKMNTPPQQKITDTYVSVLVQLDRESKDPAADKYTYGRCGVHVKSVLEKAEADYGIEYMVGLFAVTCMRLGHTLGPLEVSLLDKLVKNGAVVRQIERATTYDADEVSLLADSTAEEVDGVEEVKE